MLTPESAGWRFSACGWRRCAGLGLASTPALTRSPCCPWPADWSWMSARAHSCRRSDQRLVRLVYALPGPRSRFPAGGVRGRVRSRRRRYRSLRRAADVAVGSGAPAPAPARCVLAAAHAAGRLIGQCSRRAAIGVRITAQARRGPWETELEGSTTTSSPTAPPARGSLPASRHGRPTVEVPTTVATGDVVRSRTLWPGVAAPGYDLYYLNVMAGPGERAWRPRRPVHAQRRESGGPNDRCGCLSGDGTPAETTGRGVITSRDEPVPPYRPC